MPFDPLLAAFTYAGSRYAVPMVSRALDSIWNDRGPGGIGNSPHQAFSNTLRGALGLPYERVDRYRGPSLVDASTLRSYFHAGMRKLRPARKTRYFSNYRRWRPGFNTRRNTFFSPQSSRYPPRSGAARRVLTQSPPLRDPAIELLNFH